MFVSVGYIPTRWNFDYQELSYTQSFDLVIRDVVSSTLNIGIFGYRGDVGYNITVSTNPNCISCINGICASGICVCYLGWSGPACDAQLQYLRSGVVIKSTVNETNDWSYFHYVSTTSTVVVSMEELGPLSSEAGFLYLIISEKEEPTLRRYDYLDADTNRGFHSIVMMLDDRIGPVDWIIGVYGSPYLINPVSFKLIAWEPK